MSSPTDSLEAAIRDLWWAHTFEHKDLRIEIALLLHEPDWRPLKASWWRGKEVCIIGSDLSGNFLLRHCDGTVRYWHHGRGSDTVIAPSIKAFAASLAKQTKAQAASRGA